MSKLKEKSVFNFNAAQLLSEKCLYASSVHCSYYSCFQIMKYTIKDFFDITYSELSKNITSSSKNTHRYIIDFIKENISGKVDISDERNFSRKIKDLKQFREESDYEDIEVCYDKCKKAYDIAEEIRGFIIKTF